VTTGCNSRHIPAAHEPLDCLAHLPPPTARPRRREVPREGSGRLLWVVDTPHREQQAEAFVHVARDRRSILRQLWSHDDGEFDKLGLRQRPNQPDNLFALREFAYFARTNRPVDFRQRVPVMSTATMPVAKIDVTAFGMAP